MKKFQRKVIRKIKRIIKKLPFNSPIRKIVVFFYKELLWISKRRLFKERMLNVIEKHEPNNNYSNIKKRKIMKNMLYYKFFYLAIFDEYYMYGFNVKKEEDTLNFITNGVGKPYLRYLNVGTGKITKDKYKTYEMYSKYYKREMHLIKDEKDYDKFKEFCEKYPIFIKKVVDSQCGKGVELIDSTKKNLKSLFKKLLEENNSFVIEEKIEQDPHIASFHPESVNTIRIFPLIDEEGKVTIHYPFFKVGQNNSIVDNAGAGGIIVAVNPETGELISDGYDESSRVFERHPNTNVKFKGFVIPKWKELVKMIIEASKVNPNGRYLGFDVALSKKGWMVVEINSMTAFIGQQLPLQRGIRKEFEEMIKWKKEYEKIYTKKKKKINK